MISLHHVFYAGEAAKPAPAVVPIVAGNVKCGTPVQSGQPINHERNQIKGGVKFQWTLSWWGG